MVIRTQGIKPNCWKEREMRKKKRIEHLEEAWKKINRSGGRRLHALENALAGLMLACEETKKQMNEVSEVWAGRFEKLEASLAEAERTELPVYSGSPGTPEPEESLATLLGASQPMKLEVKPDTEDTTEKEYLIEDGDVGWEQLRGGPSS
jgi:hypothetical protein